ncbi:uncharacterized protein LOC116257902 [Nymphaea colorata]|nr:uncharacterized protein LOC116257902 [Nymphaea colorata]
MESENFQIFVESFIPGTRRRALEVSPNQTLRDLKLALLPLSETLDSFYFSLNGKSLGDLSSLSDASVRRFSTLFLRLRALGGGGDGGATGAESRDCYLNMYATKKPDKVDPNETRLSMWTTCRLSGEPLKPPCVIDQLGNVFNKEALVEALLGKKLPKEFGHIRGLRDMITIRLAEIPGVEFDDATFNTRFQCPISGLEFNGKYKFFALRGCGHVLSAKAVKEVQSTACLVCHRDFVELDKIVINGDEEEVKALRLRMEEEKNKLREKKEKKGRNGEAGNNGVENVVKCAGNVDVVCDVSLPVSSNKKKAETNGKIASAGDTGKGSDVPTKRLKTTIRTPANATKEVYESIFTSSKKSNFKETYSCRSLPLGRN